MRILIYNDYAETVGGAEVYLNNLESILIQRGHEVRRFAFAKHPDDTILKNKLRRVTHAILPYKPVFTALQNIIKDFKPDLVHIHNNSLFTTSVLNATQGLPRVMTVHDPYQFTPPLAVNEKSPIKRIFKRRKHKRVAQHVDHFVTHSLHLYRTMNESGFKDQTTHIPIFINMDDWSALRQNEKMFRIIFTGRIETYKGVFVLLEAYKELKKAFTTLELHYCGEGAAYQKLIKQVLTEGLSDDVHIHGLVDDHTLRKLVSKSLIAVVPSVWQEPFGLSGLEAQACGTAVVASNTGGIPEWCVDGVTGLCVIPGNPIDLAHKVKMMIEDRILRRQMIQQALTHIDSHFSVDNHYLKLVTVYEQVIHEAGES